MAGGVGPLRGRWERSVDVARWFEAESPFESVGEPRDREPASIEPGFESIPRAQPPEPGA
jgi:hypothetical protein